MTVYFQHWTGEIRWIQLTPKGEWLGGSKSEVIVTDAKNATPISVVAYAVNGTAQVSLLLNFILRVLTPSISGIYSIFQTPMSSAKRPTPIARISGKMARSMI